MFGGSVAYWKSLLPYQPGWVVKTPTYIFSKQVAVCAYIQIHYLQKKAGLSSYHAVTLPGNSLFTFCVCLSLASFLFYSHL